MLRQALHRHPTTPWAPSAAAFGKNIGPWTNNHDSNAAISGMWNIDYFHGSNKIVKEVVNGWTISPVVYLISGGPFTVSTGSNNEL